MRLVMMGTGPFAAPMFAALCDTSHEVATLVTQPLRSRRKNKDASTNETREIAVAHDIPIYDPEKINTPEAREHLANYKPDLFVVADYGQILSAETLGVARLGGINLHGSLLPKYRGAAPINWAIYNGDTETGVTVIHMTPRIDAGPAIAQRSTEILPDEDAVELETRLAALGAPLVCEIVDRFARDEVSEQIQNPGEVTKAPRLKKSDGQIDWSRSALQIKNQVRAMEPWPRTFTTWPRPGGQPLRLILGQVEPRATTVQRVPGEVVSAEGSDLVISTGDGELIIHSLQPAGKRMLGTEEFLRGYRMQPGDHLE